MAIMRFHCPFVGLSGCQDGGGNGLTKTSLITHFRDRHFKGGALAITKHSLATSLLVYEATEVTLKRMGIWLCGVCFKTHTLRSKCRHDNGSDFVPPPDCGDGIVRFVLFDLVKPQVPSSGPLTHVDDLGLDEHGGFDLPLLDTLLSKGLRTVKSIPPKCRLGFSRVLKVELDKVICMPDDISRWVSLLVLPLCLLKTFCPRSNIECRSATKRQRQEEYIANAIRDWGMPGGCAQLVRETLAEPSPSWSNIDVDNLDLCERNVKQCKRKICDGHYTAAVRVLSSSGVAPYNHATLESLQAKHPFKTAPPLPLTPIDNHHFSASAAMVCDMIKSFPRGTSCGRDGLRAQHLLDCLSGAAVAISDELVASITQVVNLFLDGKCPRVLGEYIASAPLTPLVKPGGGIRPIAVGTILRRLVSKVSAAMIGHSLDGYLNDLQFGVGVSGGGEAILHAVNRLIEDRGDDIGLSMLLVDFQNAFNLVDRVVMLQEVRLRCPAISRWVEFCYSTPARLYYGEHILWSHQGVQQGDPLGPLLFALVLHPLVCKIKDSFSLSLQAWYLDDGTIVGDTLVVGKVLEFIMVNGPRCGLHLNVDKTEVFWPNEDPRSRLAGVFPPNIARPLRGVKLLGGPASVGLDFSCELVMKRVAKTIELMGDVAKINDPQCELLLLRACTGISKLYFAMRTCSPRVFERAQSSFDVALRSSLERIVTASGSGFGDWQWRLATLPFAFGGLGVYSAGDVLNYAFLASRLQSAILQAKLLRHSDIVTSGPSFNDALCSFNEKMGIDLLSNPCEIAAPKQMKKLADIYFTRVTQAAESTFSLSSRQMALWKSQMEDYTSDWLRVVPISGLGQTMNARTYRCVLCYRLGVPLFSVQMPCSACSKIFPGDIFGDHAVSCPGIIGIKHRHNVVRDTLVDICSRSGVSVRKEVDIGLTGERDNPLRPADVLLYSWDGGLDVCVDLTGSSPLTQSGMVNFLPGRAVSEAAQRKRVKYEAKCANIGYGFLPFSFSSFGELEKDAVTLLKRIRKFSVTQDIGARDAAHIFSRISFAIARGVGAQIWTSGSWWCSRSRAAVIPADSSSSREVMRRCIREVMRRCIRPATAARVPIPGKRNILITSALPYVNNIPHLGNIIGCVLSADVYARYCRLRGYNVLYICGTDEYGTTTETKALEENSTPKEICDKYHAIHRDVYKWFDISFDYFGRTSTPEQTEVCQAIFSKLLENNWLSENTTQQLYCDNCSKFLADRLVEGSCPAPACNYGSARGDQCEICGKLLNPTELVNPKCKVCGTIPRIRDTEHMFLELPLLEGNLREYISRMSVAGLWSPNAIHATNAWLKEGLRQRCITRDLKWGVPVPLEKFKEKVFYVWFDAPIGYISITKCYTPEWEAWWKNPENVELYQFMGKDNVPFHTIMFPSTLIGTGESWTMMKTISVTEYLNYESGKFSKSKGIGVFGNVAKATGIPVEVWRYYLLTNRPEVSDTIFTWTDLQAKLNNELINNLGNVIYRVLSFIAKDPESGTGKGSGYKSVIPDAPGAESHSLTKGLADKIGYYVDQYVEAMEKVKLKQGLKIAMSISGELNAYLQANQFWKLYKEDPPLCSIVMRTSAGVVYLLACLLEPFMPSFSVQVLKQLNMPVDELSLSDDEGDVLKAKTLWEIIPVGHRIGIPDKDLFKELEDEKVESLRNEYAGSQADRAEQEITINRLDIRVGIIKEIQKHPDADSLYVEKIDVGEEKPRTAVSGLVKYIPIEEMQNRKVCVLCNLKPATMLGIKSHAMVLCTNNSDHTKVEFVEPPQSVAIGERVKFSGFDGEPDDILKSKKVWETLQVDLHTDKDLIACFKDLPFTTSAGVCKVSSISDGPIH